MNVTVSPGSTAIAWEMSPGINEGWLQYAVGPHFHCAPFNARELIVSMTVPIPADIPLTCSTVIVYVIGVPATTVVGVTPF